MIDEQDSSSPGSAPFAEARTQKTSRKVGLVGQFIRHRREALNLSQRSLGQLFEPAVTTQFISNVERGVTPLPPTHVATLARALQLGEDSLLEVLEKEYAMKLFGRIGKEPTPGYSDSGQKTQLPIDAHDYPFMSSLYDAYRRADETNRKAFLTVCESLFKLPKNG